MINAQVREKIYLDDTPQVRSWCNVNLIIDNPEYHKKERMGKWTGDTPRMFYLYEHVGDKLLLPFGVINDLYEAFPDGIYKNCIHKFERNFVKSNIVLYPYQESAVQNISAKKNGIVVMPCGAGKTQTALEAVARIGGNTLWLTHTQDLLNQSKNRALSVLDIPKEDYGMITAGKIDIGKKITFATVQTMSKIDVSQYRDVWDVIIVDECQHCCGTPTRITQFYKVLSNLSARYKIGLTATPKRADGLEKAMFALLGNVIHEVTRDEVAHTTCPIKIVSCETGYQPDYDVVLMGDGTINYSALVTDMTENAGRFERVLEIIESAQERGGMIVLANRVEYLQRLNKRFSGKSVCLSGNAGTKKAREVRKDALRMLNCGELDCVFASYKLAAEGLDCPNLKYVVLATPEKDSSLIQQATGRVGRKAPGKEYGTVIDFIDNFGMYKGWAKKREAIYKKLGYDII